MTDLARYQDNSVVSQAVVKKKAGTVTVFAFDKGEGLSEHTAPFDALILILEGHGRVTVSGQGHDLGAGDMIIMPAGKPHSVAARERFKMLLVMVKS